MIDYIKSLSYDSLKKVYKEYLSTLNISKLTQNTASVDAFYLWRHGSKELFWDTVLAEDFEIISKNRLTEALLRNSNGISASAISAYYSHLKRFRMFVCGKNQIADQDPEKTEKTSQNKKRIPQPCVEEIEKYLEKWKHLENYHLQEKALDKLFHQLCPENTRIEDVLLKCAALNDFYSTNIFSIYPVAKHIVGLNIDGQMKKGDITLVNKLQHITINGKTRNYYSFATKYCSHHNSDAFPIYDHFVERVLVYFQKEQKFSHFELIELKEYSIFKKILTDFREYFGLTEYSLKQIDQYIWQLGKEYFPKTYKKER